MFVIEPCDFKDVGFSKHNIFIFHDTSFNFYIFMTINARTIMLYSLFFIYFGSGHDYSSLIVSTYHNITRGLSTRIIVCRTRLMLATKQNRGEKKTESFPSYFLFFMSYI